MAYSGLSLGGALTPWVRRLMVLNGLVFMAQLGTQNQLVQYLAFVPFQVLQQPWTVVTYMFAHGGFMHLFFNMLALFFFGPPLEARWGSAEFIRYYLVCGLGGAALSYAFAPNAPIIGASAAVYGVMLAFAMNWPDAPIYIWAIFPIPAKYLVAIFAVMSFVSMLDGRGGNIAHAAHLGGFAAGWLYIRLNRPGGALAGLKRSVQRRGLRVVPGSAGHAPTQPPPPAPAQRRGSVTREEGLLDELDRVLDKISTDGIASLSPDERRLLDEVSRRYRQN
ncbi:MAG: rhomboid family intramembrane serine protease [Gemmatimonadetes bacterium]|nr:rhomboid family intramembrane serine protease [Gemmatimonadota bacterium]